MIKIEKFSDPAHGWYRVSKKDVADEVAKKISSYSYITPNYVYLEEDIDASIFIDYLNENNIQYTITRRKQCNSKSAIRSYGEYSYAKFKADVEFGSEFKLWNGDKFIVTNENKNKYYVQNALLQRYAVPKNKFFAYFDVCEN